MCAALRQRNLWLRSLWAVAVVVLAIGTVQGASPRWEPQIAVLCEAGQIYQPQYLSEEGRWVTDLSKKTTGATCLRDKMDLLDYCKKAYPNRDITNIVESSHYQKIGGWCRQGALNAAKCKGSHRWIKPFRCLEGPFQSDALLVPEGCLFDHIHNASRCWPFVRWNQTGAAACQERGMQMRSFAMLLPCGISLFSGVEFVCCPKHFKTDEIHVKKTDLPVMPPAQISSANDELNLNANEEDDSNDSNYSKDANDDELDDEDDLMADDEEDEMVADEAAAAGGTGTGTGSSSAATGDASSGSLDDINAEYDSGEDGDNYEEDGAGSEGDNDSDTWDQNGSSSGAKPVGLKVPIFSMASSSSSPSSLPVGSDAIGSSGKTPVKPDQVTRIPIYSPAQAAAKDAAISNANHINRLAAAAAAAASAAAATGAAGAPPSTAQPTSDPYFTHFDPHYEHQSYKVSQKEAQQRLEESHREKVTRVMKDWSDLEEKYQDMRLADPKAAQSFKQRMTARFQALEEEGNAEKHQLAAMHQQRVLAHINQRKREAMTCYTQALTEQPPNAHHVEKCLQKLLRALHKDRAHALAHYRHLLNSGGPGGLEAAASERPRTLERLIDIDRAVNQSMTMLKRYPELSAKIAQLMNDYILALRSKDDIPGSSLGMSEEAEAGILDKYRIEIERKVAEKERLRLAEKQRKEQRAAEREKLREEKLRMEAKKVDDMLKSQAAEQQSQSPSQFQSSSQSQSPAQLQAQQQQQQSQQQDKSINSKELGIDGGLVTAANLNLDTTKSEKDLADAEYAEATVSTKVQTVLPTVDDDAVQRAVEDVAAAVAHQEAEPQVQHFMTHDLGHRESSFSLRREFAHAHAAKEGRNVYFTLSFAGIALMAAVFVGVAVAKWRTSRSPHAQGFIEVDQNVTTHHPIVQEEKIVPNMQINGYENPTYKYFEVKE
ncbi:amyloid-beta-like protein isoform X5 [Drosophila pseudoobscura]|uniref:Amyloid-beta-like protein isoform X5 n=1 Tax=Drosophila pseudoobscura pseudoobscura TaxID=46245 RepID=A0A6I8VHD2_DROPS|nr:amyloid-beta-like protein isoform X5 [Drosophila pseudoobscura]